MRIQCLVDELLDAVDSSGQMDVIADLAYQLPATIIAELLGVPIPGREIFKRWSDDIAEASTWSAPTLERAHTSQQALTAYLEELVRQRRARPADDVLSDLVAAESSAALTEDELLATCVLLLFAGHATTTNFIGNATLALLRSPGQLRRLQTDQALIGSAIEELLRFESPVQAAFRRAKLDFELHGQTIRRGDHVLLLLGAANRDPDQFPDPDTLDLGRQPNRHLAFSMGAHYCLGAHLARLEGRIAIQSLFRRFPSMQLAPAPLVWRPNVLFRGLERLSVVVA